MAYNTTDLQQQHNRGGQGPEPMSCRCLQPNTSFPWPIDVDTAKRILAGLLVMAGERR